MKKRIIILVVIVIILLIIGGILLFNKEKNYDDENTLYFTKINDTILRFERYDYSLGQNQIVGVEKSTNNGKSFEKQTDEPIIVSMEPKFVFLNENLGFAISKSNLSKSNNFLGVKVTQDGGKTFTDGVINYYTANSNPNIETLTITGVPYIEGNVLKLSCSIYQVKIDNSGYENVKLIFISTDNGLSWNIEDESKSVTLTVKSDSVSSKGAIFILKNNTDKEYWYGPEYTMMQKVDGKWNEVKTITGEPLTWNAIAYTLKANEEIELNIDWSLGYGKLKSGDYALVKSSFKEDDRPIDESKKIYLYGEFSIK